jgi:hypothetical protein
MYSESWTMTNLNSRNLTTSGNEDDDGLSANLNDGIFF